MKILLIEDTPADQSFVKELFGRFNGVHYDLVTQLDKDVPSPGRSDRSSSGIIGTGRIPRRRSAGQGIHDAH